MGALARELIDYMKTLDVIDTHSHLCTEEEALASTPDVLGRVLAHYSPTTMFTAGLDISRGWLKNASVPLAERWAAVQPYIPLIRESGYSRVAWRTASILFGIDDINDSTYEDLSRRIADNNTPGLYDRVLKGVCKAKAVINQGSWYDNKYAFTIYRGFMGLETGSPGCVAGGYRDCPAGAKPRSPEELFEQWFGRCTATGCLGVKFCSDFLPDKPDKAAADAGFTELVRGEISPAGARALSLWLLDRLLSECGRRGLVVCVHCGINWTVGDDFYPHDPRNAIVMALRHKETKFDLYHAGIPWVREIAVVANQCPNIYLNLVWAADISPNMTTNVLNEWLDLVPVNKIIGYGSDVTLVEKTAGMLEISRECIADALEQRLEGRNNGLTLSQAGDICKMFLYDNPVRLYNLPL